MNADDLRHYETFDDLWLSRAAIHRLEPFVRQAVEEEWEDEKVKTELTNFANELAARRIAIANG